MKAVVLEIKNGMAAVMKEDGTVEKVKRECEVGDVIEISEKAKIHAFPRARKFQAVAAAAVAVLVLLGGTFHYRTSVKACTFVSMDVNPSLEYVLNSRDRVLTVKAWNEDATPIVDFLNTKGKIKGRAIDEAISETTQYLKELGYLGQTEKEDNILVSVATSDDAASERVAAVVRTAIEENEEIPVRIEVKQTTLEEHKQAEEYGISTGRYVKAVEGKEREADASGEMTEESKKEQPVLTAKDLEKVMNEPVENLVSPDVPATINGSEIKEANAQDAAVNTQKPAETVSTPDKKTEEKKDGDKKKKKKEEKEKKEAASDNTGSEEGKSTEAGEASTEPNTETETAPEPKEEKDAEEVPGTESTEGEPAETEPSTEVVEPVEEQPTEVEMTDEERAAAEQEEVRRQQEIEQAEAEAQAEAVRQQQEIQAAEGVVPAVDPAPSQAAPSEATGE